MNAAPLEGRAALVDPGLRRVLLGAAQRLERAVARGWSTEQFNAREAAQMPLVDKAARSHIVIRNARTLENWEQGRARPNAQAALLINLVKRYPDTIERLAAI